MRFVGTTVSWAPGRVNQVHGLSCPGQTGVNGVWALAFLPFTPGTRHLIIFVERAEILRMSDDIAQI